MIRIISFLAFLLFSIATSAQVSQNRTVGDFSKLKVSTGVDLIFTQDSKITVKVEADDSEKLQDIVTKISGSTLEVYVDSKNFNKNDKKNKKRNNHKVLKVYVAAPNVDSFQASSSGSITSKNDIDVKVADVKVSSSGSFSGNIKANEITIKASSSGDVKSHITTQNLTVDLSSSGDANLSGTAENTVISASSSGDFNGKNLTARKASVEASSSADVTLNVTESLKAKASSSASISYSGNPAQVEVEKSSSGSVNHK